MAIHSDIRELIKALARAAAARDALRRGAAVDQGKGASDGKLYD
jgi:hypothetical protein